MKTVLITGANRGLGRALLEVFLSSGYHVIATCRDREQIKPAERLLIVEMDLSDEKSLEQAVNIITSSCTSIDLLINNAGFNPKDVGNSEYFESTFRVEHFSSSAVMDSLRVNALMPMKLTSSLLSVLSPDAVVLNVSSYLGSIGQTQVPGHYGYAGSKALLNMFTKALSLEFEKGERSAVAFNPGWMKTDMGGQQAYLQPLDVASSVLMLYQQGTLDKKNGSFIDHLGENFPW